MANIFYTSDLHFGHKNILKFNPETRPFSSIEEMEEGIIKTWNETVGAEDTIYILGDFSFYNLTKTVPIICRLSGKKVLIAGNHDKKLLQNSIFQNCFSSVHDYLEVKVQDHYMMMFHFPIWEWNKIHHGAIHLHGHVHGKPTGIPGRILDAGWDNQGKIFSHEDVVKLVGHKEIRNHGDGKD